MPQKRRVYRQVQEYPGSTVWKDEEVLCPECHKMCREWGEVSTEINGEQHYLCIPCGNEVMPACPNCGHYGCDLNCPGI